jgi:hypothetical protein
MGTRSLVAVMHGDVCKSVYCHYDGYLDYTGRILLSHYDSTAANALIARGDNSGVKETLEEMNFYADREAQGEDVQEFVNSTPWQVAHTFDEFLEQVKGCWGEYYYVMKDGVWYAGAVYDTEGLVKNELVLLKDAIAAIGGPEAEMTETQVAEVLFK